MRSGPSARAGGDGGLPARHCAVAHIRRGLVRPCQSEGRQIQRRGHRRDDGDAGRCRPGAGGTLGLHAALGKALEDRKQYAGAFTHYAASAALRRARIAWPAAANTARLEKSEALLTRAFFAAHAGSGDPAPDPIFIVGLPRSGSTLLEQILASHSAVEGTMELSELGRVSLQQARARGAEDYLDCLAAFDKAAWADMGRAYLDGTRLYRKTGAALLHRQDAQQFQHVGLIQLILPNAKIIDARRGPMAACFFLLQAAFRARPGLFLRPWRSGPLLPRLCPADGAFRPVLPGACAG